MAIDEAPQDEVPQDEAVSVESQVEPLYQKIAAMTSEQVLNLYGESAIEGMIVKLGRNIATAKRPAQKATFLLNLVRQKFGNTDFAADETA